MDHEGLCVLLFLHVYMMKNVNKHFYFCNFSHVLLKYFAVLYLLEKAVSSNQTSLILNRTSCCYKLETLVCCLSEC